MWWLNVLQEVLDDEKADEEMKDDASTLIDEVENIKGEAEQVEFPGMYG